ncbi:UvrD-helicase domain-containing protein [Effusibacillus lacus]|uniref:DNA 3'-5' helicase n=1 Tax=Effusibacillus lacus TaxID=1348429 RepID=A0A292YCD1_9BACL|nr:UvrD-helicase domain-containing protein [Effusibacillus lacus]TCS75528.1 ATP-dependent exoDNAse (exonuclease V) beta subunit [Effusibacillus lacus]GAX88992.1 hypothetical protein EFBL_0606 [Effusibacillus lacus]
MTQPAFARVRNPEPNEAQLKAIVNLDDDLLVAAGAGSGKTWVLTERYMEMLVRGARPSQIVAITFTELAAAEMKRRIRGAVQKWIDETADLAGKKRLRQIYRELDSAIISTIHGFCMRLLKEHPVEAGIDPMAEMLEPDDADRLLERVVEEVLEDALREQFEGIQPLYAAWGGRSGIAQALLSAYQAIQTFDYSIEQILDDTGTSFARLREQIRDTVAAIDRIVDAIVRPELGALLESKKPPQYAFHMEAWVAHWQERSALLRSWDGIVRPEVRQTIKDLLKTVWKKSGSEALKEAHEQIKQQLLPRLMRSELAPDAMERVRFFCGLLSTLDIRYRQLKEQLHMLDFHDLEQLAAKMLEDCPEVAVVYGKRFRFLMIDEFQDTNRLQKSILDRISSQNGNLKRFLVGDGKQSIYKFRGADVDVFQEVEEEHRSDGSGKRLIDMGINFRTQAGIICYINDFFENLMRSAEAKHVRQVRFAPLHAARNPGHGDACVEFLLNQAAEDEDAREAEADLIARRIRELVDGNRPLVYRKKAGEREETAHPVRFGDIAMLFSATTHLSVYEQALQKYGVPYIVEKGRHFYKKREIADICSWLSAIADPGDETSLAALLRSPVFALSDETLFWLAQEGSLASGLAAFSKEPVVFKEKLQAEEYTKTLWAVEKLAEWRESCRFRPLADFLRSILDESGYLQVLLAGFGGEQRYANVLKLVDLAEEMQRRDGYGLGQFVKHLRRMRDEEVQETEAQLGSGSGTGGGAVRLMTVHASKGLEFPVVILPDLKRSIAAGDAGRCIIRPGMGMGLKGERFGDSASEGALEVQGDGLYHIMKEQENERELLEEHRKLYVAMTRARDYLILVMTKPKTDMPSWQKWIRQHAGFSKWNDLVPGLCEKGDFETGTGYRIFINTEVGHPEADPLNNRKKPWELWRDKFPDNRVLSLPSPAGTPVPALLFSAGNPDGLPLPMLSASAYMAYRTCQRRFYLRYLFRLPEMRFPNGQILSGDPANGNLPDSEEMEVEAGDTAQPDTPRRRMHADLRGTLVHEMFEHLREPEETTLWIRKQVESARGIRKEDRAALVEYLESMAERYLKSPWFRTESLREQAFYLKAGSMLVHGFIDAILPEEDGSLTVVDFKTNEIRSGEQMAELVVYYRVQLQLYALAAQSVFQRPVGRAVLFFLDADKSVDVDVSSESLDSLRIDLRQTCNKLLERCTIESYPMTEDLTVCGKCGYRTLCGRNGSFV